uniref:BED-type domain-containing protein n=1 Tax=Salarias fasciatus TaxID=181472 RepID=A0A672JKK8_SALFA
TECKGKTMCLVYAPRSIYKSEIWTHFGFYSKDGGRDKSHAICKMCLSKVKYCGNTTNLRAHVARHHQDVEVKGKQATSSSQLTLEQVTSAKFASSSPRAAKITHSVIYYMCKDMRPLSTVEGDGFRFNVNTLEPRYTIPSRQHFIDVALPRLYKEEKTTVLDELRFAERVALTCDAWTSRSTESYVTVTAHHIDEWKISSHVLQTRPMYDSHTGENIAALLREVVAEWGLRAKEPVVVTDNAPNMAVAARLAEMDHIKCFAHSLNLASQKALKLPAVARLLGRIRRVTGFFRHSTTASHQLQLITDVITRWNSSYDMTERFLEQQPAIVAALLSNEEVLKALKAMKDATKVMSEEGMPTLSVIAPLHAKLVMETEENSEDSQTVKDIKAAIAQDLSKRHANDETLYMTSAVDPQFKNLPFLPEEKQRLIYSRLTDAIVTEKQKHKDQPAPSPEPESQPIPDMPPVKRPRASCALADLLGSTFPTQKNDTETKRDQEAAEDEVKMFRMESPLPLNGDPLNWWMEHEGAYPHISTVARRFLCIPGTSVSAERVFSTAGDIVTAKRSVLKAEHVDQLVFLQKNLKRKHTVVAYSAHHCS